MDFMDDIRKQAEEYGGAGGRSDFFKFENPGVYKIRILDKPAVIATHFFGEGVPSAVCVGKEKGCQYHSGDKENKPSIKLATYIIDRQDENRVKLAELPLSISYAINDLQKDEDFKFDSFPMPYDVKITYDPKNKDPKAKYRLVAAPQRADLTDEELKEHSEKASKMTPEAYVDRRKKKQMQKDGNLPHEAGASAVAADEYPSAEMEDINPDDIPF